MQVTINNNSFELKPDATLEEALIVAGIKTTGIATAVNGTVVARDKRDSLKLNEGDKILIITAFYGG
jgi:thiamine biosynthesis protein thiS